MNVLSSFFKSTLSDRISFWCFYLSIFFLLVGFVFIVFTFKNLPPFLPIYNKLPWGFARLGSKIEIFIPLLIAIIYLLVNNTLSFFFQQKTPLLSRFLFATTLVLSFFTCFFLLRIIQVVL